MTDIIGKIIVMARIQRSLNRKVVEESNASQINKEWHL